MKTLRTTPGDSPPGPRWSFTDRLVLIGSGGVIALLVGYIIAALIDWIFGLHTACVVVQIGAVGTATMLFVIAAARNRRHTTRISLVLSAILILLIVADTWAGRPVVFTDIVLELGLWALMLTLVATRFPAVQLRRTRTYWFALGFFWAAVVCSWAATIYYLIPKGMNAPVAVDLHLFRTLLLFIVYAGWLLQMWLKPTNQPHPGGIVRRCDACGLANIPERRTCKRCGHVLD